MSSPPPVVDYDYCASSYLALRHVYRSGVAWKDGVVPVVHRREPGAQIPVRRADEMDQYFSARMAGLDPETTGVLLSGGMDSAIVASYLPAGTRAFSFRFVDRGTPDELRFAREYADSLGLRFVEVPITGGDYTDPLPELMAHRNAPVHSIEPQIYTALRAARDLGITLVATGENADSLFGGFDGLVSTEWAFDDFVRRYTFVDPARALRQPADYYDAFETSRVEGDNVDAHAFMSTVFAEESLNSYLNPAGLLGVELLSPFAELRMRDPLDLARVQRGESKYLVRELFRLRFPGLEPHQKLPMPRSVESLLAQWQGPTRPEFLPGAAAGMRPDQRWMMFALERFLEMLDDE